MGGEVIKWDQPMQSLGTSHVKCRKAAFCRTKILVH